MQVSRDTVVDATVLNAGFSPTAVMEGAIEVTDIANGAITAAKLAASVVSGRRTETVTADHRLVHETGGNRRRAAVRDLPPALPWYWFGEQAGIQAPEVTDTTNADWLWLMRDDDLGRLPVSQVGLSEVTTAGTYRVGTVTVDAKGRVLSVSAANHWTTGWRNIPFVGDTYIYDHDLGRQPALVQVWLKLRSVTGDAGWETGDVIEGSLWFSVSGNNAHRPALSIRVSDTRLYVSANTPDNQTRMVRFDGITPSIPNREKWQVMVNLKL